MKRLLAYLLLVLSFTFIFNAKADDIRDFEIEGINIGESLINYFSKKDIKKSIAERQGYKDNSFVRGIICSNENKKSWCRVHMEMKTYDRADE